MSNVNQQKICIGPEVPVNSENPLSILLPNPGSGLPSRYVIQDGQLFEIQVVDSEGLRSWFIKDTVQSDGSLYITTPIDPVFMFIPILDIVRKKSNDNEGRFLSLDDIFDSDQYTSLRRLSQLSRIEAHLAQICDIRDSFSTKAYRLNDDNVLVWLKSKVKSIVDNFSSIKVLVSSIVYTESLPEACRSEAIIQSSLRLVSAYLSDSWAEKLAAEYQFPELEKLESRTQLPSIADFGKRLKMDDDDDLKESKEVKKPKMTLGQKRLAKASTGMKPLSSFFTKKSS
ncbi:Ribonuclease H2 subunit B [Entomortierella beljakovae]|nr:Ribonuclease H2 subunit B [Entomortierella beljakovae]